MASLALALLVQAASEEDARKARALVDQLASDQVEERDLAFERLVEMGEAALPSLQKARSSSDAEVAERIERIAAEIGRRGRLRTLWPPPKRQTLDLKGATPEEAAVAALAAYGIEAEGRHWAYKKEQGPVRFSVRDATVWETLDAVEPQLGLKFTPTSFFSDGAVTVTLYDARPAEPAFRWTTQANVRIFVRPCRLRTATGEISPFYEFSFVLPPELFTLSPQLDGISVDGKPLSLRAGPWRTHSGDFAPPRRRGRFMAHQATVTSLDPDLLKGRDRLSLRGTLALFRPREIERIEFGEEAKKAPLVRETKGVRLTYQAGPSVEAPYDSTLRVHAAGATERQVFLGMYEDGKRVWLGDYETFTCEPGGSSARQWHSGNRLLTLTRLIGAERVSIPFEIRDVPVPAAAGK